MLIYSITQDTFLYNPILLGE